MYESFLQCCYSCNGISITFDPAQLWWKTRVILPLQSQWRKAPQCKYPYYWTSEIYNQKSPQGHALDRDSKLPLGVDVEPENCLIYNWYGIIVADIQSGALGSDTPTLNFKSKILHKIFKKILIVFNFVPTILQS